MLLGEGTVKIETIVSRLKWQVDLEHVLPVPVLSNSLLSIKMLTHRGHSAIFSSDNCSIANPKGTIIVKSQCGGNLYDLCITCSAPPMASTAVTPAHCKWYNGELGL